jgi:hypothetical protein
MKWNSEAGVARFKDRDIIIIELMDGLVQPFYRSTGRASAMPGVWLPFDGCALWGWFIKDRFGARNNEGWPLPLHRFGCPLFKHISDELGMLEFSAQQEFDSAIELNKWLRSHGCMVPREIQ